MGFFSSRKSEQPSRHRSAVRAVFVSAPVSDAHNTVADHHARRQHGIYHNKSTSHSTLFKPDMDQPYHRDSSRYGRSTHALEQASASRCSVSRADPDLVTSTLAQRLNDLAVASSEGLLTDDEYRLLRSNIFDRLANNTPVPTEKPLIALNHSHPQPLPVPSPSRVKPRRTPSVSSRASVSSTLLRFLFGPRRTSAGTFSETASTYSTTSLVSPFKRSGNPRDPKTTPLHNNAPSPYREEVTSGRLRSPSYRSTQSVRLASPPSSFTTRCLKSKHSRSLLAVDLFQDDESKSSQRIHTEIEAMEAEANGVVDSFNGLELSLLTQGSHKPGFTPQRPLSESRRNTECNVSFLIAEGNASGRGTPYHTSDVDGSSLRSSASCGTSVSQPRSHRPNQSKSSRSLLPPLLANRKRSFSSLSSSRAKVPSISSPKLMHHHHPQQLRDLGSVSSINLTRSLAPTSVTSVDEDSEFSVLEAELEDIRRRRREVTARYQDRLAYLRAQLKGAELREKLLRK